MLISAVDKISSIFDRAFVIGYWAPVLVSGGFAGAIAAALVGPGEVRDWWEDLSGAEQGLLGAAVLVAITVAATVLQALAVPITRLFQGHWPAVAGLGRLRSWAESMKRRRVAELQALSQSQDGEAALAILQLQFPNSNVRATRLGNVFAAAEDYSFQMYRVDAAHWWPRLTPLLPETLRSQIDQALTLVLGLLNMSGGIGTVAVIGSGFIWWQSDRWLLFSGVLGGGLLLAWLLYNAAVEQAIAYGRLYCLAFDQHRKKVLEAMEIPFPEDLVAERHLWQAMGEWVYLYRPPWESANAASLPSLARPFKYRGVEQSTPKPLPTRPDRLRVEGQIDIRRRP
ncbi:MAG: hypothetical protein WEC75_03680 [Dehalococcoidia bacterium]